MRTLGIAFAVLLLFTGSSEAQMLGELRGGVFTHDLGGGLMDSGRIADANVEFLFKPLVDGYVFGSIHPHIGVTANFGGGESYGYAGLTWHLPVALTPVFVEAGLGAALGSDAITGQSGNGVAQAQAWNCAVMGHAEGSVGVDFAGVADVMLTAEHYFPMSCGTEPPVTNVGARLGISF
jgi:hypothetical protein